jgi:hypothetical protein
VVEEYLIQESLTGCAPFEEFFHNTFRPELPGVGPGEKRRVIAELASLVRRMHDRGISRPNLEPRNLMAAPRPGGGVKLMFVDLGQARPRSAETGLSREERVRELAQFHINFCPLFSQGYCIRFFREYFAPDRLDRQEFRELVKRIVDLANRRARQHEQTVVRAVAQRKGGFFWFTTQKYKIFLRKPLYQNALLELAPKLAGADNQGRVRVKQVRGLPPQELTLVKCARMEDLPAGAENAAHWAFVVSAIMEYHGMAHFKVMAAVEVKGEEESYYLAVPPGKGEHYLAEYLARRVAEEFSGFSWDRRFLLRIARFILALHELGWHYPSPTERDLWVRSTDQGTHQIRLFNLHQLRQLPPSSPDFLLKNLFHLWRVLPLSQPDGLMLAEEYLRFSRRVAGDRHQWLHRFLEWQMSY